MVRVAPFLTHGVDWNTGPYIRTSVHPSTKSFWANVCKTVRPMLSDRCLSVCLSVCLSCPVLSVTFVHCGQTVGRIKVKLGVQIGLGPGHIVLDGDPALPPLKGHSPHPIFDPYLLRPNGCMDQDVTWYGGRPHPMGLCVRWRPRSTLPKKGQSPSPIFGPFLLWPNGCMHQDATWYGGMPQPRDYVC